MGHYDDFYEAAEERQRREERARRRRHVVTVEQEQEFYQTNVKMYGLPRRFRVAGLEPTREGEKWPR